jgi:branched-chain amino acid transport system permease protein
MFQQTPLRTATLLVILAGLSAYTLFGGTFAKELVIEVSVLAILAVSLDILAGFGGLVSLGHGALAGLGAYAYAAATLIYKLPPLEGLGAAIVGVALCSMLAGAVTARINGIFLIMATLAFGQMAYVLVFESRSLGGDDGMPGLSRLDLRVIGLNLNDATTFALFCVAVLAAAYAAAALLLAAGFGRTLVGLRENEVRMRALGVTVWQMRALAFGFSGALAGLSGALAAQHSMFVSPELLTWTVSGECLLVVILGGIGTLVGPVLGAVTLIFLKHISSGLTSYWHMVIGFTLILTVAAGGRGMFGGIESLWAARKRVRGPAPVGQTQEGAKVASDA